MTTEEIAQNEGYVMCAAVYLKRAEGLNIDELASDEIVSTAIRLGFDGDEKRFLAWADDYISDGCGVTG